MISRISSVKLLKEEIKHHLVSVFVVVLVFLAEVLFFYFDVQSTFYERIGTLKNAQEILASMTAPQIMAMIPTIILAILLAAEYFSYLHSRKKSDFYMSLPIKRKEQFLQGILVSGIVFCIPCVIAKVVECVIAFATGYGTVTVLSNMFWNVICTLLIFAAVWITMVLAMIMTGNLVVAILGFGAFASYIPVFIRWLLPTYKDLFYETFVDISSGSEIWYYFSPIGLATGLAGRFYNWELKEHWTYLVAIVVYIILVGSLSLVLYKKRPAEAAGKAMAFEKINFVIRFFVVVPLALYCGYFLSQMSMTNSKLWLGIGVVIGAILLHGIMESIFAFDLQKMLSKKRQLLITVLACFGFVFYFHVTVDDYNSYIPKQEEVETIFININDDYVNYYENAMIDSDEKGITDEYIGVVLALAENMVSQNNIRSTEEASAELLTESAKENSSEDDFMGYITLEYKFKNGFKDARRYYVDFERIENRALIDLVFGTKEFKDDYYKLYHVDPTKLTEIYLFCMLDSEALRFTDEEKTEFVEIYLNELSDLTYTEKTEHDQIARVDIKYEDDWVEEYPIYDNFEETIAFMKEYGIDIKPPFAECEILNLRIYRNGEDELYVDDLEVLEQIKDELILEELYAGLGYMYRVPYTEYGAVEIRIDNRLDSKSVFVRKGTEEILRKNAY